MPISTDSYQNIEYNGNTVSQIGLSKTIDNYTWEEIFNFQYCAMSNQLYGIVAPYSLNVNIEDYPETNYGFNIRNISNDTCDISCEQKGQYIYPNGMYCKIIWLKGTRSSDSRTYQIYDSNTNLFKLVTSWDAPNYIYTLPNPQETFGDCATSWNDNEENVKTTWHTDRGYGTLKYRYAHDNTYTDITAPNDIFPYLLYKYNNHYYCQQLRQVNSQCVGTVDKSIGDNCYTGGRAIYPVEDGTQNSLGFFGGNIDENGLWYNTDRVSGGHHNPWNFAYREVVRKTRYCNFDNNVTMGTVEYGLSSPNSGIVVTTYFKTKTASLLFWAGCGIKFFADKLYKPIISDGYVSGFTDDMSTTSDLDNWSGETNHAVPDTPPAPPSPESQDNEIDVDTSQFAPSIGFVNYIEMDYETAVHVASAFNTYNASIWNIGGDLFKNLISYKIFAMYGTHSGTIKNISIAGHELEYNDNPISGNYIDDIGVVDLGSITVGSKFKFNDWRDFAPYTKIECFVPCCGWCQLPPWVMGRTVTGTIYIDLANGSCKALIFAGRTPVAEIGGCCAIDVPFSSVATGAKAAGVIGAITNGAVAAFNPTPQNLISGSFGILSALNANYTETKGVMGDGSNINGCTQFLIKVTRPASTDTGNGEISNAYKHEKGLPCAKTLTLTKGDGFTQITDAKITGTMTAREKQMIVDGFRHGLVL